MKIALITAHECPGSRSGVEGAGGLATYVRGLALEFARRDIEIDIFTTEHGRCPYDHRGSMHRSVRVHHVPLGKAQLDKRQIYERRGDFVEATRRIGGTFDLVYSHYWISGVIGVELSRTWDVPHATTFHTLARHDDAPGDSFDQRRRQSEATLIWEADGILTSSAEESALLTSQGVPPEDLFVTPPGVDVDRFQPRDRDACRERLGLPTNTPILLWAGRFAPVKGLEDLLLALTLNADTDARLIVVGGCESDPHRQRLQHLARVGDLENRVAFVDAIAHDRLGYYYGAADMFVFPSHHESFGLAALEASASGIPVVGTDVGGLRDIIHDGRSGVLVSPREPIELAAAIRVLLEDESLRVQLGGNGRRLALERRWARAGAFHLEAIARLCASARTSPQAESFSNQE